MSRNNENKVFHQLDWNKQMANVCYIQSMASIMYAKALKISVQDLNMLIALYTIDRPMRAKEFAALSFVRTHKKLMPLIVKGYIQATQTIGRKRLNKGSEMESLCFMYYLTYEGRILIDCYYGAMFKILDNFRLYKLGDIFFDVHEVIKMGFAEYGYDLSADIYDKPQS